VAPTRSLRVAERLRASRVVPSRLTTVSLVAFCTIQIDIPLLVTLQYDIRYHACYREATWQIDTPTG
jgi:hypothetical protein